MRHTPAWPLLGIIGLVGLVTPALLRADADRLKNAEAVLIDMAGSKDSGIPTDLIAEAKCIVVVPGVKRAALLVGAQYGRGYMTCRRAVPGPADGSTWSAPAGVRIEGGSFGPQIGGSETDVLLIVKNEKGVERLLSNQFTIGAEASVAAGPVGRQASAHTDATMRAEMLAYSHSRGVFAGAALQGATLREDTDENRELYGSPLSNREIVSGKVPIPAAAQAFIGALVKY
jgi:lipid-binding SYLF domain-containing protein